MDAGWLFVYGLQAWIPMHLWHPFVSTALGFGLIHKVPHKGMQAPSQIQDQPNPLLSSTPQERDEQSPYCWHLQLIWFL